MATVVIAGLLACGCSSDSNVGEIAGDLEDQLTDALAFEGGSVKEGEAPAGVSDTNAPQLTEIKESSLRLGAEFAYALSSDYSKPEDVTKAIVFVSGASKYIEIPAILFGGLMDLPGRLKNNPELSGKSFKLAFAMQNSSGLTGKYMEINVNVSSAQAQEESENDDIANLSVSGADDKVSKRPESHTGEAYPQIKSILAPAKVRPGVKYRVSLYTDFAGTVQQVVLTTPGNEYARFIDIEDISKPGIITLEVVLDEESSDGYQYVFMWALMGDQGAGLYRSWLVIIDKEASEPDGDLDRDTTETDETIDGDNTETSDNTPDGDDDVDQDADNNTDGDGTESADTETDGDLEKDSETGEEDAEPELEVEAELEAPAHLWSHNFGDANTNQFGRDVAAGPDESVYMIGDFYNSITIGGTTYTSLGLGDIILTNLDANGDVVWAKKYGDTGRQDGQTLAVDADDNVIVAGHFSSSLNFSLLGEDALISQGATDIYLAKIDSDGNHVWSMSFGDTGWDYANSVAVDAGGNIYLTGEFEGTVDFGGGALTATGSNSDVYLAKFNSAGVHQWSKHFGDASSQYGVSVAVWSTSAVVLAGDFYGTVNFGGDDLTSDTLTDVYFAVFSLTSGAHVYSDSFGDAADQNLGGMTVSESGEIYLIGSNYGTIHFDQDLVSNGDADIFVARYNLVSDAWVWSAGFGDAGTQYGTKIEIDANDNVIFTGRFNGTVNFGGSDFTRPSDAALFLAMYNSSNDHVWSSAYGASGSNVPIGLGISDNQRVFLTGTFNSSLYFDSSQPIVTNGLNDIFVAAFAY